MSAMSAHRAEPTQVFAHLLLPGLGAAVEARERGRGPVALCDPAGQRVVSASPAARRRGVRPGTSRWEAQQRCPDLRVTSPDPRKYEYFWQRAVEVCGDYTPQVRAFPETREIALDLTGTERLFGPAKSVAQELRNRLRGEVGLEAAIGIGPNAMTARLAARQARPGEVIALAPREVAGFVGRLPVAALPGVEAEWARWLGELGIKLARDLAALPAEAVGRALGARGRRVWEIAQGRDPDAAPGPVSAAGSREEESVSAQVELRPPTEERARIRAALRVAAEEAGRQLRRRGEAARQVRIEFVFRDLRRLELRRTLQYPTRSSEILCQVARALFDRVKLGSRIVRRVRIHAARLTLDEHGGQLPLPFLENEARRERLAETVERIRDRYGERALRRANVAF